ncbi:MAG: RHS repeat-associated core domain-containing protein [Flavobacteriales bacterium]|nr:RHS repeat-associated core domain-containing protein [Flavobacteriales bacterium]
MVFLNLINMGCLKLSYYQRGTALGEKPKSFLRVVGKKAGAPKKGIDYYAFGSIMPQRSGAFNSTYRYGFNGMEKDDEVKGSGNSYDFGARIYDPRLGRWLAVDPLFKVYVPIAPYAFGLNNPIFFIDEDGRTIFDYDNNEVTITGIGTEAFKIEGTSDTRLIQLLTKVNDLGQEGIATLEMLDDKKVRANVTTFDERMILEFVSSKEDRLTQAEVSGLNDSEPTSKRDRKKTGFEANYDIKIGSFGGFKGEISEANIDDEFVVISDFNGEALKDLSSSMKADIVANVREGLGPENHAAHIKSLEIIGPKATDFYNNVANPFVQSLGSDGKTAYTLIYETASAREGAKAIAEGASIEDTDARAEAAGKVALNKAVKQTLQSEKTIPPKDVNKK